VKEACLDDGGVEPTDDELVRAFVERQSEEEFRLLFRRHTPALLRLAERLLGRGGAAAEDVVQEVWIRVVPRLPEFRFESRLRTWLCGFVVNRCREVLRAGHAEARLEDPDLLAAVPGAAVDAGRAVDLERAVRALADGYRSVFVLHDLMGFTHDEIAAQLSIAEGTSKSQLFLARRALRRHLGGPDVREGRHDG
jgi:RNA polymerase sigma factor (sigma-70 family)